MIEIEIPYEFIELCSGWAGDTDCMLRAIDSTGGLTLGTIRPYLDDADRYFTDEEWHVRLWNNLSVDVAHAVTMATMSDDDDLYELTRFEEFCDATIEELRKAYGLEDSEVV